MAAPAEIFTKRILVAISHAIERFALASDDGPMVVLAMFQRLTYFEREVEVYQRLARGAALVLVGVAEDFPPRLPDGVAHLLLHPGEDLARVWGVTVLSPRSGAMLRCSDLETVEPHALTLEAGRRFFGSWSFCRSDAYGEVVRQRGELKARLAPHHVAELDAVLERVMQEPGSAVERRADAALHEMTEVAAAEQRQRSALAHRVDIAEGRDRDSRTGLRTGQFVQRFTSGSGAGTLPVALLLVRVHGLAQLNGNFGFRAEHSALLGLARVLTGPLTEVDHAARLGAEDFLLLMPSRSAAEAEAVQQAIERAITDLSLRYPFVALPSTSVLTTTRNRPLPVPAMLEKLEQAVRLGHTAVVLPAA